MKKIALIEDDKILSDSVYSGLKDAGFAVVRAFDGEEGLKVVETEKPDLVLLDILLPKLNGLDVAKKLKSNPLTKAIPIIILSVLDKSASVAEALDSGVYEYMAKGNLTVEEIVARVKEKLGGS
ncbi:MAG: response regulator [bacterium]|nr:response regulator [bacterium]